MCLTGTPVANSIIDLYGQLEFLGPGLSGFSTFKAFREYYTRYERRNGRMISTGYQELPMMQERLARLSFMISKEEALPALPDKMYDMHEVGLSKRQLDFYIRLQHELAVEAEEMMARDEAAGVSKQITANNILTRMLRLAQITAGFVKWDPQYTDDGDEIEGTGSIEHLVPNPKIEALVDILKEKGPKDKTIIWSCFVSAIEAIHERLTQEGIEHVLYYGAVKDRDREEAMRRFNEDPNCPVFLGNPATCKEGVNLWGYIPEWEGTDRDHGCNCNHVIYYIQDWSMIKRSQSEDRSHRRGTRCHIRYTDLVVPTTIDEEIRARVLGKKINAEEIQDVRAIMEAVLSNVPSTED
jgi:SNF2 family DNA or RNA helicase